MPARARNECPEFIRVIASGHPAAMGMIALGLLASAHGTTRPGMYTPIIAIAIALTSVPTPPPSKKAPPPPPGMSVNFVVDRAEVEQWDNSSHLITYDADGEVTASLVIWSDESGQLRFDADFADGLRLSAVIVDEEVQIESDDSAEVVARVAAIDGYLKSGDEHLKGSWLTCAAKTAATAFYCASANPVLCLSGTVLAACDCVPLILGKGECF
jgi:hypothetical protein